MRLRIARRWFTGRSTTGQWFLDDAHRWDTLEDRVRRDPTPETPANEGKVYGETAIPPLVYVLRLEKPRRVIWSPRNGKDLPEDDGNLLRLYWRNPVTDRLEEVPGFTGIYVHAFNRPEESLGCIAPGTRDPATPDWIGGSRDALKALMREVCPAVDAGDVELAIEEFGRPPDEALT